MTLAADSAPDWSSLLTELVRIPSVNPDLVPGGEGEVQMAQHIAEWAHLHGLESHWIEPVAGRPSVVVARGSGGGRSLMLNGHLDTVGVAGMADPYAARREDGKLYGRGAFDMKGGLAACLWAAAQAKARGLLGDVIVTCVADEEVASLGMQAVLAHWHADAAIVTEPTGLDVCTAHKGFVWLEVTVYGRAAHGSRPTLGRDAIAKAGAVLTGIAELDQRLRAGKGHPLLGTGSVHVSLIRGGQEMSSYPESCTIGIERRTVPGETLEGVVGEIQAILDAALQGGANQINVDRANTDQSGTAEPHSGFRAEQRVTLVRDPFEVPQDAEIVKLVQREAERETGQPRRLYGDTPWMDAAFLSAAGIPTVVFGAGGGGAHALEEWADLESVKQCAEVLLAVATAFCGQEEGA
ncbi:ArgE/DapE family deacylase [Deinococcus sp. Arct2-2]|uniref:ArgE/DapE family deacylase n=1 Tax=Deinococcus sp. Arct2-2 TaxID=2568653 RepID=UPI0010A53466|nr:ArgE/DapE family deacylase [Deinococcus sp. Arct2-2]THF69707.1 ArgE/DapE family deacylase [Deinococcus sp. Arct2-2]